MRALLVSVLIVVSFFSAFSQVSRGDSLQGFNPVAAVLNAHQRHLNDMELRYVVRQQENEFLKKKFTLQSPGPSAVYSVRPGSGNSIANAPCLNEGFEGLPTGAISASGWTASVANIGSMQSMLCYSTSVSSSFSSNNATALVLTTPITDANCNNVSTSPFGGSNVVLLNKPITYINTRLAQTFSVTASNFIYQYAYKAYSDGLYHACCDAPSIIFNFYDCSGNLISGLSDTLTQAVNPCANLALFPSTWSVSTNYTAFTPNWVVISENLIPYIGSCVTVEVIASGCTTMGHTGYCYYDANCTTSGVLSVNQTVMTGPSYTTCTPTATLSALLGFSNYLWQGPPNSGVSGSTSSVVTTGISGNYTLSASLGTLVSTQTLNLVLNTFTAGIVGKGLFCAGDTTTLNFSGTSLHSYTWSTGSGSPSITAVPPVTTVYTVSAVDSIGCVLSGSKTVTVYPNTPPSIGMSDLSICPGQADTLVAIAPGGATFTWSTNSPAPSIVVSPSITTVYTVSVTNVFGCASSGSTGVIVNPSPVPQLSATTTSLCIGNSVGLSVSGTNINSYLWSTGDAFPAITKSPTVTTVYSASVTNLFGCTASISDTISVYPLPQCQIAVSNSVICIGQTMDLAVTGSNVATIQWSTGSVSPTITVTPSLTTAYSATVTTVHSCTASALQTIRVDVCTGIPTLSQATGDRLMVFPNPAAGSFLIKAQQEMQGRIVNALGQMVSEFKLSSGNNFSQSFHSFAPGIYFVTTTERSVKLIVE